jgi:hypothetical protein
MVPKGLAMSRKEKLIQKARENPTNLTFKELLTLAQHYGAVIRKSNSGGHTVISWGKESGISAPPIPLQPDKGSGGKAKAYQVKQIIAILEDHGVI